MALIAFLTPTTAYFVWRLAKGSPRWYWSIADVAVVVVLLAGFWRYAF